MSTPMSFIVLAAIAVGALLAIGIIVAVAVAASAGSRRDDERN